MDSDPQVDDRPHENCGIFGVYGVENAARVIYAGLFSLQHRGQEGAGIVASDGAKVASIKGMGLLTEVFSERSPDELIGHLGIGHVRYSTTGDTVLRNVQPFFAELDGAGFAIGHNGNLTNALTLREELVRGWALREPVVLAR